MGGKRNEDYQVLRLYASVWVICSSIDYHMRYTVSAHIGGLNMSLRRIAEKTGVSISTVSRVINGTDPKCASPATKELVWQAARAIGYQPNATARRLQKGEEAADAHVLGVVLGRTERTENDFFFQALSSAIAQETVRQGASLGPELHAKEACAAPPACSGIVVLGRCSSATLQRLHSIYRQMICVGLNAFSDKYDQVICNGHAAAAQAVNYLVSKGHRRIGYVGECYAESRYIGYRETMMREKLPMHASLVYEVMQTEMGGMHAAQRLLGQEALPDALFCANDITAMGLIRGFQQSQDGRPLPAVVSIDDISEAQTIRPALTTIHIPKEEMGAMAVKMLLDRLQRGHQEALRIEFPCRLVRRASS